MRGKRIKLLSPNRQYAYSTCNCPVVRSLLLCRSARRFSATLTSASFWPLADAWLNGELIKHLHQCHCYQLAMMSLLPASNDVTVTSQQWCHCYFHMTVSQLWEAVHVVTTGNWHWNCLNANARVHRERIVMQTINGSEPYMLLHLCSYWLSIKVTFSSWM